MAKDFEKLRNDWSIDSGQKFIRYLWLTTSNSDLFSTLYKKSWCWPNWKSAKFWQDLGISQLFLVNSDGDVVTCCVLRFLHVLAAPLAIDKQISSSKSKYFINILLDIDVTCIGNNFFLHLANRFVELVTIKQFMSNQ